MLKLKPALQESEGRSKPWAGSRLVNAFAEKSDGDKAEVFAIMAIPGLALFSDISSADGRGLHTVAGVLYTIVGQMLYSVASTGVATAIDTVAGTKPVHMADNGTELAIVGGDDNTTGYVYSGGVLYTGIANLPPVSDVIFIDGYFLWTIASSDQFIISGLYDGLTYDPLDVATAEGAPDFLVGAVNSHREVVLPGTETGEVWFNSGAADFPFERQGNAFVERGCIDRDSLVKADNSVFFAGNDRIIYRLDGYQPARISTHNIETKIASAAYFRGFSYAQEGHTFYGLNTDLGSWIFDIATGAWAERKSHGRDNYRVGSAAVAYGQTILGDNGDGKLYTPDLDVYTENGTAMPVIIELPLITSNRDRKTMYVFEVYCETGVGNSDVTDPQIILEYSKDGGRNWSNELWRSMGAVGEYLTRAVWRVNVEFRQLQLRITMPDKARRCVLSYFADIR